MTILVRASAIRLRFPVPLSLLRLLPLLPDEVVSLPGVDKKELSLALYRALQLARQDFRGLDLVHVRSAKGDEVIIKL